MLGLCRELMSARVSKGGDHGQSPSQGRGLRVLAFHCSWAESAVVWPGSLLSLSLLTLESVWGLFSSLDSTPPSICSVSETRQLLSCTVSMLGLYYHDTPHSHMR